MTDHGLVVPLVPDRHEEEMLVSRTAWKVPGSTSITVVQPVFAHSQMSGVYGACASAVDTFHAADSRSTSN